MQRRTALVVVGALLLLTAGCNRREKKLKKCLASCEKLSSESSKSFCRTLCEGSAYRKMSLDELAAACKKGEGVACRIVFFRIEKTDPKKAAVFLKEGCTAKEKLCCGLLGRAYRDGKYGLTKDKATGLKYLAQACDQGEPFSCTSVGLSKHKSDPAKALSLFLKACAGGAKYGCGLAGVMYRDGRGTTRDVAKARVFMKKACDLGAASACKALARLR